MFFIINTWIDLFLVSSDSSDLIPSQAILKSYVIAGSDIGNPEKILAYMVPSLDEVDMFFSQFVYATCFISTCLYVAVPVV